jgi:hypothetical protein
MTLAHRLSYEDPNENKKQTFGTIKPATAMNNSKSTQGSIPHAAIKPQPSTYSFALGETGRRAGKQVRQTAKRPEGPMRRKTRSWPHKTQA